MMRERHQKQATASSAASTAPSSVDVSKTASAVPTSATPGSSQQQQGNKRQLTLTVCTNMCHWLGGHSTKNIIMIIIVIFRIIIMINIIIVVITMIR